MSAENKNDEKGRKPKELALDAIVGASGTEEPKPTDLVNDKSSGTERYDIYYIENDTIVLKLMSFSNLSQYVLPQPTLETATTTAAGKPDTEEHPQPDSQRYTHSSQTQKLAAATGEKLEVEKHQQPDLPKYVLPPPASEMATTTAVKPDQPTYAPPLQTPEVVVAEKYESVVLKEMLKTAPGPPDGMVSTAREGGDSTGTVFREFQKTTQSPKKKQNYLSGS